MGSEDRIPAGAIEEQVLLDAALRNNFLLFVERCFLTLNPGKKFLPNWHHKAIEYVLESIRHGTTTRSIINIQPRSLKSLVVSVAYPASMLAPRKGDGLSEKDLESLLEDLAELERLEREKGNE